MKRGELYRVENALARDPKKYRVSCIVSRQALIESRYSTVVCAPIYPTRGGLSTQVSVGIEQRLKHDSAIYCDELVSLPKNRLTHFVGSLSTDKIRELNQALRFALALEEQAAVLEPE